MPDARTLFAKTVGIPLKSLLKGEKRAAIFRELLETQWYDRERLHALRTARLKRLLVEVTGNVPFYRDEMRRLGSSPSNDDPWQILRALPILDKDLYRSLGDALASEGPRCRPLLGHSSGTTGARLEVRVDRAAAPYRYLAGYRGRSWWGIAPGDPEVKIWGSGRLTARTALDKALAIRREVKEWVTGVTLVSPFFQTDVELGKAAHALFRRKPVVVFGYANSIAMLSSFMLRTQMRPGPGWPKAVFFTSETMTEHQKDIVRRAFAAPVVAEYGSVEAGVMAFGCPAGGLHTSDDISIVEIVGEDGVLAADEVGEVVVTSLMATDFPLIRYRQGDLASIASRSCACGRTLGTLSTLQGRLNDVLRSPSGGIIDFIVFDQAMKDQASIRRFRIVEKAAGDIDVLCQLHAGAKWSDADRERLVSQCAALLPKDVRISTKVVGELQQERSGKFRIIVPKGGNWVDTGTSPPAHLRP